MSNQTIRETIVAALEEGAGPSFLRAEVGDEETLVFTAWADEPIRVLPLDVVLPDGFPDGVAAGIALDVRAILVDLQT